MGALMSTGTRKVFITTKKLVYAAAISSLFLVGIFSTLVTRAETLVTLRVYLPAILRAVDFPNPLSNPGFEEGYSGWNFFSTQGGLDIISSAHAHSGLYSARLGNWDENYRKAYISQYVAVPIGRPWLTYWHYVDTPEDYCPMFTRYDFISIQVNLYEEDYYSLCDDVDHPNRVWLKQAFDLSAYQGMRVYLRIYFESDGNWASDIYVDDFNFEQ